MAIYCSVVRRSIVVGGTQTGYIDAQLTNWPCVRKHGLHFADTQLVHWL